MQQPLLLVVLLLWRVLVRQLRGHLLQLWAAWQAVRLCGGPLQVLRMLRLIYE